MDIRGYLQTSVNEWPGKISAVVWVAGCNFRCPFCQNRDLILFSQDLPKWNEKTIFADLKKRKGWLDAVVITGGEPGLQPDLDRFLASCRRFGLATMIETNGTRPAVLANLFKKKLLDRISMDIKGPLNDQSYQQITRVKSSLKAINQSLRLILSSGVDFELRTTVVPTLHTKKSLMILARQLKNLIAEQKAIWYLQQFVPQNCLDPEFEKLEPYSPKQMIVILAAVKKIIPSVKLRGV